MSLPPDTPRHGGALVAAARRFGGASGDWLDLSTGINPLPYPLHGLDLLPNRLPDPEDVAALLATARDAYRLPEGVSIVAAPGSDMALRLLPLVAPAGKAAVVSPTYSGHEEAWRAAGRVVERIGGIDGLPADVAIVVLCNPNNPDGRVIAPERLVALARRLGGRDGLLVVDEAFADVAPKVSLAPSLEGLPAVVLRSFGKFYGLAGLRLGFVAGRAPVVERLGELFGDWPISGPARAAGRAALADRTWRTETSRRLESDSAKLSELLEANRFSIVGRTPLFVLAAHAEAQARHEHLARQLVWTRIFAEHPNWIRFGIPREEDFPRLEAALQTG